MSSEAASVAVVSPPAADTIDRWGQVGYLTADQAAALSSFLEKVDMKHLEEVKFRAESFESVALRFLRARQFAVEKALLLVAEAVELKRKEEAAKYGEMDPNEAAQCDVDTFKNFYPHGQNGFDKMNRPILFEHSGAINPASLTQMTQMESLVKYHWWTCEHVLNKCFDEASKRGELIVSTFVILDMSGLGMQHVSQRLLDHVKNLVQIDNVCYPELLGKMLIINAPWLAVSTWGLVKGWLDERTQNKIEFVPQGPQTTQRLLEFIEPHFLPVSYGGEGPEFFEPKPHTDFVTVHRGATLSRTVLLEPNQRLVVDSYLGDSDMRVEMLAHSLSDADISKIGKSKNSNSNCNSNNGNSLVVRRPSKDGMLRSKDSKPVTVADVHVKPRVDKTQPPSRVLLTVATDAQEHKEIQINWHNPARLNSRALVYSITKTDMEQPTTKTEEVTTTTTSSAVGGGIA